MLTPHVLDTSARACTPIQVPLESPLASFPMPCSHWCQHNLPLLTPSSLPLFPAASLGVSSAGERGRPLFVVLQLEHLSMLLFSFLLLCFLVLGQRSVCTGRRWGRASFAFPLPPLRRGGRFVCFCDLPGGYRWCRARNGGHWRVQDALCVPSLGVPSSPFVVPW